MKAARRSKGSRKMDRIIDTATELFTKHGIRRITIEEICRAAGASKMTFYKYFDNKIDLLHHIWERWFGEGYRVLDEIDAMDIPFSEKMQRLIEWKMNLVSSLSSEFLGEVLHASPELAAFIGEMKAKNISRFMAFVERAQSRGDMREMRPEFFLAVMNKMQDVVYDDTLARYYPDRLELIREVHNFLFFGILPVRDDQERP
jgi:AcrR family transcriptional regulator